jgi:hypothetical protein
MIQIKRFIEKIASIDSRQGKDVVLPIADARALRDEITTLLIDQRENATTTVQNNELIEVVMKGGSFQ